MTPQAIVDLLLSLLPVVASIAPSVYAALFGTATVESMTTRAREALAKAGGARAAMEALFEPHPVAAAVAREMPQVSAHTSDRIRGLSGCSSLTAEDREACAKGAAFIAAIVARADTVPAPSGASVPEMLRRLASLKEEVRVTADGTRVEYLLAEIAVIERALEKQGWGEPKEGD